jgi:hypothetical protein
MIQTKEFSLSKKKYFKIILINRFKKAWWLYLLMILLGILSLPKFGTDSFSTFFVIFSFSYPILISIYLYYWVSSKDHEPLFLKTKLSFNDEYLFFERDGNESKLIPSTIQKVLSKKEHWLLYISKDQFIYIPKNIFYNTEDHKSFSQLIKQKL